MLKFMKIKLLLPLVINLITINFLQAQTNKTAYKKIGKTTVYEIAEKKLFLFQAGMMIDADGSPKAYHPVNGKGLDHLANAGHPGNWWALVVDSRGNPIIQKDSDPAPGYYISTTALQDKTKKVDDPNRQVNSESISYIALPPRLSSNFKLGDIALVINKKNKKQSYAIFADVGPADKIGEGSIKLAEALGINSNPKNGGTTSGIIYVLLKDSGKQKVLNQEEIEELGKTKLTDKDISDILKIFE